MGQASSLAAMAALISSRPFGSRPFCALNTWSARGRDLHARQSVIGSEKVASWPEYFQTRRFIRMAASRPSMSSRSCTTFFHQARLTLFFSSTPSGP